MFESLSDRLTTSLRKLTGRGVLRPEDVDATLREVRMALLEADVNFKVVKQFQERVRERLVGAEGASHLDAPQQVVKVVHDELMELLGGNTEGLRWAAPAAPPVPTVVMLAGLQGSGKTTTAVKLALWARREAKKKPMLVALDLRRPAAVLQLRQLAEREKVDFHSGEGAVEAIARAGIEEAQRRGDDLVILDTAGRLHVDGELMEELRRLKAAVPVTETLLVADSMTGQEAVNVGGAFAEAVGVDGVILTKLDGDSRGGAALSLRVATGQRIRFAGTGEKAADLEVFHADRMASRILGMGDVLSLIEKAERVMDQEAARQVEKNLRAGTVTFDDFLLQIKQLRAMGPMQGVLDMLPGMGQLKGQMTGDPEAEVKKMEAIILSMTRQERAHPAVIDGRRRRRIAGGSGTRVEDVNRLLKSREQMEQLLKQFGRPGKGGLPQLGSMPGLGNLGNLGRRLGGR